MKLLGQTEVYFTWDNLHCTFIRCDVCSFQGSFLSTAHTHREMYETLLLCSKHRTVEGNRRSVGIESWLIQYHKLCSVNASVLHCSELSVAALNYLRDSSHLWGNPTDSPLCPMSPRRGRRVAGPPLPEITWQGNLAVAALVHGCYLVQRLRLQMKLVLAAE